MSALLKVRKQLNGCTNSAHPLSKCSRSECACKLDSVISGDILFSKGMENYLMESYMKRTSVTDLQYAIARLFRSILIDQISIKIPQIEHKANVQQMIDLITSSSDEQFRTAFKKLIPKTKCLRNFVLRCYATYWCKQIRECLDDALLEGIDLEHDLILFLTNLDGTFKQATALCKGAKTISGVFLTMTNQFGKVIHPPRFVPVENGDAMIEALVEVYKKVLE
eukprot:245419_1